MPGTGWPRSWGCSAWRSRRSYGGAGAGFTELGIVAQEMGRALFCGPFLGTAVLATAALLESADDAAQRRWLPAIAAGELIATLALPGTLARHGTQAITDPGR